MKNQEVAGGMCVHECLRVCQHECVCPYICEYFLHVFSCQPCSECEPRKPVLGVRFGDIITAPPASHTLLSHPYFKKLRR